MEPRAMPVASIAIWGMLGTAIALTVLSPWLAQLSDSSVGVLLSLNIFVLLCGLFAGFLGEFRPVIALFSVFMLCWLVVPAAIQVPLGLAAWGDTTVYSDVSLVNATLGILLAASVAFFAGYSIPRRPHELGRSGSEETRPGTRMSAVAFRALAAAFVCLLVATALLPLVAAGSGGVQYLFAARSEVLVSLFASGASDGAAQVLVRTLPDALALGSTLVGIITWRWVSRMGVASTGLRVVNVLVIGWGLAMTWVYVNPFGNSRYLALAAIAGIALVAWYPRSSRGGLIVIVTASFGLLFVYPLANAFRFVGRDARSESGVAIFGTGDFDGFQQAVNAVFLVGAQGHTGGTQLLSAALMAIPRSLWPGKAEPSSILVAEHRGYDFTNLSLPLPFEFYLDVGVVGMIVLMLLWGLGARQLDNRWGDHRATSALIAFIAVAQMGVIRGPLASQLGFAALTIIVLLPCLYLARNSHEAFRQPGVVSD